MTSFELFLCISWRTSFIPLVSWILNDFGLFLGGKSLTKMSDFRLSIIRLIVEFGKRFRISVFGVVAGSLSTLETTTDISSES